VVVGQFFGPVQPGRGGTMAYRFHCFIWDPKTNRFTQLDFPRANTYIDCHGINKKGQVIGRYIEVTPTNEYIEYGWFVYDLTTTRFTLDFPLDYAHLGGHSFALVDINNRGDIVGQRSNGQEGDGWNGLFLYRSGTFYTIQPPADFLYAGVSGISNDGTLVGSYLRRIGTHPVYHTPIYETHGFIATPRFKEPPDSED
jgi:uncharacterized membrane protein